MKPIHVDIEERLRVEIRIAREGAFDIDADQYGNRKTGKTNPDPDLAALLTDALTEIQKRRADASAFRSMAESAEHERDQFRDLYVEWHALAARMEAEFKAERQQLSDQIDALTQDLQTTADALGHARLAPDPLGEALNSGDGTYRP